MYSLALKKVMGASDRKYSQARNMSMVNDTGEKVLMEILPGVPVPKLASLDAIKKLQEKIPSVNLLKFPFSGLENGGYREPETIVTKYLTLVHESTYWFPKIQQLRNSRFVFGINISNNYYL